jgi:hypothetical protein
MGPVQPPGDEFRRPDDEIQRKNQAGFESCALEHRAIGP